MNTIDLTCCTCKVTFTYWVPVNFTEVEAAEEYCWGIYYDGGGRYVVCPDCDELLDDEES